MKVKKKNGSIQDFNMDKIKLTLVRVSDETSMPLTGSDIRLLNDNIEKSIRSTTKEIIESIEIHKIVVANLRNLGFARIANAYEDFRKRF